MLTTLATGAPDLWAAPPEVASSLLLSLVFVIAVFLAFIALVLSLIGFCEREKGAVWALLAFVVFALVAHGSLATANNEADAANKVRDAETAAYAEDVSDWLDESYGISVSDDAIWRLIDGEALATDYAGDRIVISFTTTTDDKLALIDENQALVSELDR